MLINLLITARTRWNGPPVYSSDETTPSSHYTSDGVDLIIETLRFLVLNKY